MRSSSKDFKKKSRPPSLLPQKTTATKKLSDLKAKLQNQRQIARTTTGKRFRDTQPVKAQSISIQTSLPKQKGSLTKLPKQTTFNTSSNKSISLSQISGQTKSVDLSQSQNLQQFGWKQQENNKEIRQFLSKIKLQKYADDLIYAGFDDLQTLLEVDVQTLNSIKMKGAHQKVLEKQIKRVRQQKGLGVGISTQSNIPSSLSISNIITNRNRPQTQISFRSETQSVALTHIPQSSHSRMMYKAPVKTQTSFMNSTSNSFLYSAGGKNFSTIIKETNNLQRKACCLCFKVTYSAMRFGNYYYCSEECIQSQKSRQRGKNIKPSTSKLQSNIKKRSPPRPKQLSKQRKVSKQKDTEDLLSSFSSISLSSSFIRQYK